MKIPKRIWIRLSSIFLVVAILYGGYRFAYKYLIYRIINDFAGAPKTIILKDKSIKLANLIIPPMPGWNDLTAYNQVPVTSLTFTKQIDLDKDVDITLSFDYEPTQVNIKDRASVMIRHTLRMNERQTHVTVINPHQTKFQNWPAYTMSTHMIDRYPQNIYTDDIKDMIFADGKYTYIIELDIANGSNAPQTRQVADQVWKKVQTESKLVNAD
jgi:hypothetical protein